MQSPTNQDRIVAIKARLEELRRRTVSTLTVTDPVSGVKYIQSDSKNLTFRGNDGNRILGTAIAPRWGSEDPWPNYVAFPTQPIYPNNYPIDTFSPSALARFRPTSARLQITTATRVVSVTGAVCETKIVYTVNGGAPVTIPGSTFNTTSTTAVTNSVSYVFPADYWGSIISLEFQSRFSPGTFDPVNDFFWHSPIRTYGDKQ